MKKQYTKYFLDLAMGIVFSLLFNHRILGGQSFHEIAGAALGASVLLHLILNGAWIRCSLRVFKKGGTVRGRILWIVDFLALLDFFLMILSGLAISKVLTPDLGIQSTLLSKSTHVGYSYLGLLLIGIHVGLHWNWVKGMFCRLFRIEKPSLFTRVIARVLTAAVFAFGVWSMISTGCFARIAGIFSSGTQMSEDGGKEIRQGEMAEGGFSKGSGDGSGASFQHGESGMADGNAQNSNWTQAISVGAQSLAIIGAVAAAEYYTEKWTLRRAKKKETLAS